MKPPPTVEEIIRIIEQESYGPVRFPESVARAILARVRESVPHIAKVGDCVFLTVESHAKGAPLEACIAEGACAWEEPR